MATAMSREQFNFRFGNANNRNCPPLWDFSNGSILYLPSKDYVELNQGPMDEANQLQPKEACYKHPILVLHISSDPNPMVYFLSMTSTDLHRWSSMEIVRVASSSSSSKCLSPFLFLENEDGFFNTDGVPDMSFHSFVVHTEVYTLGWRAFNYFRCRARYRITEESFDKLFSRRRFSGGAEPITRLPWVETARIREDFESRFVISEQQGPSSSSWRK